MVSKSDQYRQVIRKVFFDRYTDGTKSIEFDRSDIANAATDLNIPKPKNIGDVVYSFRYRKALPDEIIATEPEGLSWIIEGAGIAKYKFKLQKNVHIIPDPNLNIIEIPDSTPDLIARFALSDEQALLAKIRYNRLIDIFLGITSYSLQNHLRTTVKDIGQIEIDELYIGIDTNGEQYIIPVQAKIGNDKLGVVQTKQDIRFCQEKEKFKALICRSVSAQFMESDIIVLFELTLDTDEDIKFLKEKHYKLVRKNDSSSC